MHRRAGKMGKSLKNAVPVEEIYEAYGADTLRLHLMATGPLDASRPWETTDIVGMYRFLQRVWRNIIDEEHRRAAVVADAPADDDTRRRLHRTIDVVRTEIEALRFNTAIAKLIELNNHLTKRADAAAPRRRRGAGADGVAVRPARRRGAVAPARPRGDDRLRPVPGRRSGAARRRHRRVPGAGQRQGPQPHHRGRRRRRPTPSRPPPWPTPRSPPPSTAPSPRRSSSSPAAWSTSSSDHPSASTAGRVSACRTRRRTQSTRIDRSPDARLGRWC